MVQYYKQLADLKKNQSKMTAQEHELRNKYDSVLKNAPFFFFFNLLNEKLKLFNFQTETKTKRFVKVKLQPECRTYKSLLQSN